jgi:N-acetylglutamate synthase-like GNAT family acetyltransferase
VTRALLAAGFPPPSPDLDGDLLDLSYYAVEGRHLWVAEREDVVVGCAALDRGDGDTTVLRRLSGGALDALIARALEVATEHGASVVETVLPPTLSGTQEALARAGFTSDESSNRMLLRRRLP